MMAMDKRTGNEDLKEKEKPLNRLKKLQFETALKRLSTIAAALFRSFAVEQKDMISMEKTTENKEQKEKERALNRVKKI
jgi:hypothetical protein